MYIRFFKCLVLIWYCWRYVMLHFYIVAWQRNVLNIKWKLCKLSGELSMLVSKIVLHCVYVFCCYFVSLTWELSRALFGVPDWYKSLWVRVDFCCWVGPPMPDLVLQERARCEVLGAQHRPSRHHDNKALRRRPPSPASSPASSPARWRWWWRWRWGSRWGRGWGGGWRPRIKAVRALDTRGARELSLLSALRSMCRCSPADQRIDFTRQLTVTRRPWDNSQ